MARRNEMARRPATLQCTRYDEHRYIDDSVPQVGLYVAEQEEPDWRIEQGTDLNDRARAGVSGDAQYHPRSKMPIVA